MKGEWDLTHSFLSNGGIMEIVEKVRELVEETIENAGYRLDDVIYEKEGITYFLRIIIDKDGFIDIDDCVTVSGLINPILDENDPILENYILDVCSKEKGCDE